MPTPSLSVITPTFNGEAYLASTLDSILAQADDGIECIVVDAGSIDATLSILQTYRHRLPLKLLQREERANWVASTNHALSLAQGDYVCFLHQDDVWFHDRLSTMRRLIAQYPQVVFFLHPSNFIDSDGKTLGRWSCPLPAAPTITPSGLILERLLVQNFISIPAPVFPRELALRVGGLDETMWYTADWDFWLKIAASGDALYYPRPLTGFRIHPESQTVARTPELESRRGQLETVAERHLALWSAPERLRESVGRATRFSNEVNLALAGMVSGNGSRLSHLLLSFLSLGPSSQHRYLRDSRIWERTTARLKARLLSSHP
jgi:glycosyltransferase involved in cell wall biosynthesis